MVESVQRNLGRETRQKKDDEEWLIECDKIKSIQNNLKWQAVGFT